MPAGTKEFRGTSRFEVLGRVGEGGAGFVYEVVDRERGARLALKTLRSVDPASILLLKNEFRAIQGLSHPNLVIPKELFEEAGQFFFTMDFVDGTDFLSYVRPSPRRSSGAAVEPTIGAAHDGGDGASAAFESAPLDVARLRAALAELVTGLSALHADHKVHRDVKPSNVLVRSDGHVQILDFGIVGDLAAGLAADQDWQLSGTVVYMAPEQALGEAPTPAADWYAVGTILYMALAGRAPFAGSTHEILAHKVAVEPPPPTAFAPGVPRDLNDLAVDLLHTDPSKRPEGFEIAQRLGIAPAPSATRLVRSSSFVGRSDELRAIDDAFEHTRGGSAVTLFVEGDSGVGKSWLVREFTRRAAARDQALVFRGRCYERESLPYKAVDSLVDDLARFLSSLREEEATALMPDRAAALRTAFPVLETVAAVRETRLTRSEIRNPQEARARMFDAFRTLLVNVALYRRLVLVIDDLQWADEDSAALLTELLRVPGAPPLLLLASIRSAGDPAPEDIRARFTRLPGDVRRVQLGPLPAEDARDLVESLLSALPRSDYAPRDVDAICAEAKGHPLFIEEIVRYRTVHTADAPARLDDALWERAQALPTEILLVLELVVMAGGPLSQDMLARAAELDFGKAFDAVGVLRTAHFVRTTGVFRHDTVEPYHDRVRESVLHNLDEPTRRRLHVRLARAFEATESADVERLIPHWVGAGDTARAAECALGAAEGAEAALAFDHAASLYRLAIDLLEPAGEDAFRLKERLAQALMNAGRGADAAAVYLDAAGADASNRAIDLRRRAAEQLVCSGRVDDGTRMFESVLRAVGVGAPRSTGGVIVVLLLWSVLLALRGLKFVTRAEEELDPRERLRVDCLGSAGPGLGMTDNVRGKQFQVRYLLEALNLGEPARVCRALSYYALALTASGTATFDRAMELQKRVASMAHELKRPYLEAMASAITSFAYYTTGRSKMAREPLERTEAMLRDQCIGVAHELASARMLLYRTLVSLGELAALARLAGASLFEAEQKGDIYTVVNLRTSATSILALARDDVAAAEREIALAEPHLPARGFHIQHAYWLLARAQTLLYRGDAGAAEAALVAKMPTMKRSMVLRVQSMRVLVLDAHARACVARLAGDAASVAGATRKRAAALARALENEGWDAGVALAHAIRAGLCETAGDRSGANAHLAAGEQIFDSLAMALHAAVLRRRRGVILGGTEGDALVAGAEEWMATQGIRNPARISALFAPGFRERERAAASGA